MNATALPANGVSSRDVTDARNDKLFRWVLTGTALFVLVARAPEQSLTPSFQNSVAGQLSIEELLDADVTDGQFRALLSGAGEVDDLLAIAAEEMQ